jgi:histidinol-phosphatase (PHP family)
MREKYRSQITLLIGFEGEYIRPSYGPLIKSLAANPVVDYFIGSVHHVHEIPIDYDVAMYRKARDVAGGTDERLFEDYFDLQFEMLNAVHPKVVGHFDLIRLLAEEPNADLRHWKGVWEKVVRNLKTIVEQGGLMEINTSALRKGLEEPYPTRAICEEFLKLGGKLTLSDDSHGVAHIGTNYARAFDYLQNLGVVDLWTLESKGEVMGEAPAGLRKITLASVKESFRE